MTEVLARTIINQCMFQPKRWRYFCNPAMLVDCEEFAIELPDDDVTLNAWYFTVKEPSGYVMASYGAGNCVCDWVGEANYLRERYNVSVLVHDYRGYGKSTGTPDNEAAKVNFSAGCITVCKKCRSRCVSVRRYLWLV